MDACRFLPPTLIESKSGHQKISARESFPNEDLPSRRGRTGLITQN